ncbi:MAG: hypothetical protein JXR22_04945 [Prolixibacteraceae bacterium]|nr:hypothetical protein [Prolixibacteraceae bacterium]
MKKFLLLTVLLFSLALAQAQDPMFLKDDKLLNLGVGINYYPTISASLDYCITDGIAEKGSIGVGPYVGLGIWSKWTYLSAGARGTFHYPIIEDLDTYAGLGVGFNLARSSYWSASSFHLVPAFFIGANYPVTDKIIAFGELGSGVSYLTVGITLFL